MVDQPRKNVLDQTMAEQVEDMEQLQTSSSQGSENLTVREVNVIDLMIVIAKYKKLIFGLPLLFAVIAAAYSLAMPNVYMASTKLLPPQQAQSGASMLLSQLGGAGSLAAGMTGLKNPGDVYVGMLKSRTIADRLIARFDLKKHYKIESSEKARKHLADSTAVTLGKDGLMTVDVYDRDKQLAPQLANAYVDELTKLTKVIAVTEASKRRLFFEQQLEQAKNDLTTAEASLKGVLDTRGVISVDVESRGIIETVGRIRAQISAKEIQLNSLKPFVTENNARYRQVEEELNSLRVELARLENGRGEGSSQTKGHEGLNSIKLLRDVKYYQMLYELLAKQYEVARLDEAKDSSVIQVLDPAVEPERKAKPSRSFIVVVAALVGLFLALIAAFGREAGQHALRKPQFSAKWSELRSYMRFGRSR
jgi:uncharacterized protein involved in exopolysaccharide biosynthesis